MTENTDDIDQLMAVMAAAFDPAYGEAWTRRQVEDSLLVGRNHYFLVNGAGQKVIAGQEAAGFFLSRTGYEEEELLLLAVSPEYRRQGLGIILLNELTRAAKSRDAQRIFLEMRRGNPAEWLYRDYGFAPIGERPNYYLASNGERIDAITFAFEIG